MCKPVDQGIGQDLALNDLSPAVEDRFVVTMVSICLVFLIAYKCNGFLAIFFTSSKLYHTICRMNLNSTYAFVVWALNAPSLME